MSSNESSESNEIEEFSDFESDDSEEQSADSSDSSVGEVSVDNKSVTFIKLLDDKKTEIKYVYHISDTHIRNTHRHEEYKEVFERTYKKLAEKIGKNSKSSLIVLTGDIMHTKSVLSPEAFDLALDFFESLCAIAAVILIPGNHDCNLSNKNRMGALTPIVKKGKSNGTLDNLYYLLKSGLYQYYNIIFGVTSIYDDVLISAKNISKEIWKKVHQKNKYKIALYHGPVHGAKTDVGYRMNNEQLVAEDFDGYDYVMLGDIHKFQYMNDEESIAYAGSLIQQSFGETLDKHGILQWDLLDNESELIEIKNDYGYCTLNIVDGKLIETKIPRKPRLRFILNNTTPIQFQEIKASLEKKYQISEIVNGTNLKTNANVNANANTNTKDNGNANTNIAGCASQETIITTYLTKKNIDDAKIKSIIALHKKIYNKISKDKMLDPMHNAIKNQRWNLLELKFSNVLSYGKDNVINFENYDFNKIIGIVAPNFYGKSAILDVILFCLFDKSSRGERRDILNKNEKEMHCSLMFRIGNQKYLIERIGKKTPKSVKIDVDFYMFKLDKKGKEVREKLNGIDKNDTNGKISELIGDYRDYLMTCIWLPPEKNNGCNFINMTQANKKDYLNEVLKLNVFENCYNDANKELKKLNIELQLIEEKIGTKNLDTIKKNIADTSELLKKAERRKHYLTKCLSGDVDYMVKKYAENTLITYNELKDYDLSSETKILSTIASIKNKLEKNTNLDITTTITELTTLKKQLSDLEKNYEQYETKLIEEKKDYESLIKIKEEYIRKLITIPKNFNHDNKYDTEIKEIQSRMEIIEKTLQTNQNNNVDLNEKLTRVTELKTLIQTLRNKLVPVNQNALTKLPDLFTKLSKNNETILLHLDDVLSNKRVLTDTEKNELLHDIKLKEVFVDHINNQVVVPLERYNNDENENNGRPIAKIIKNNKIWIENNERWIRGADSRIKYSDNYDGFKIEPLFVEAKKLHRDIIDASFDYFASRDNDVYYSRIKKAEAELDLLAEFRGTKKEIDNLKAERVLLKEKMTLIENKIENANEVKANIKNNLRVRDKIDAVQNEIDMLVKNGKAKIAEISGIRNRITECENVISRNKKVVEENKKMVKDFKLMNMYYYTYLIWSCNDVNLKKWTENKRKLDLDISNLDKEIDKYNNDLAGYKKEFEKYMLYREKFDKKSTETNEYQLYVQVMNCNGLPYEMLKSYLPLIESDINEILHSMVNFNIEFVFFDDNSKDSKSKTNIDINICHQGLKPLNVQLASGFESFIVNLAIRMVLCQVSLTSKPNFFIIDEGWGCLDTENLNNITPIMNYIKTQYEHIILISHLEEIQNQSDYVINIDKRKGYSYIQQTKIIMHRAPKKK